MIEATACIGTFGDDSWSHRAALLAVPSARAAGFKVIHVHGKTLHDARNEAAWRADTEWITWIDADDYVEPDYLEDMNEGGDLRAPTLCLHQGNGVTEVPDLVTRDIATMNPCAIGTLVRAEMFWLTGGFVDLPAWEDWALWRDCVQFGATITHHTSIYHAIVSADGRNSSVQHPEELLARIQREHPLT